METMSYTLLPMPAPDVIELRELPPEMAGDWWQSVKQKASQACASIGLARERRAQLEVMHLDNPRTTTLALFL